MGTMASSTHQFGVLDLIRAGLQDLDTARTLLDELRADGIDDDRLRLLMKTLEQTCEPDIALRNLVDIIKALQSQGRDFHQVITDDAGLVRLVTVLGVSDEMGKLMRFRPELVMAAASDSCESHLYNHAQRRAHVLEAVGADPVDSRTPKASKPLAEAATALRQTYRKQLAAIMAQDATADDPIEIQPRISQELSDLADAALEGALAIARNEVDGSEHVRFAIIGMGKLGARELNYVSDVDLIYVVEPADADTNGMTLNRVGTKMATTLQRVCQSVIMGVAEPTLWQIDGGLRPEGKDGPLVRKLESHEAYYEQWAENWEFQALLKARPVAGDPDLGQAYMDMTRPFVWTASKRDNFVYDCQQMRKRVEDLIPAPLKDREIKLGRGGLRDVEFTVQMLQLVHGRADETLRTSSTLESLQRLAEADTSHADKPRNSPGTTASNASWNTASKCGRSNAPTCSRTSAKPVSAVSNANATPTTTNSTTTSNCADSPGPSTCTPRNSSTNTTKPDVKCATCTWTSTTGPCCPSTPASTTNKWNCPPTPCRNASPPSDSPTPTPPCATSPH